MVPGDGSGRVYDRLRRIRSARRGRGPSAVRGSRQAIFARRAQARTNGRAHSGRLDARYSTLGPQYRYNWSAERSIARRAPRVRSPWTRVVRGSDHLSRGRSFSGSPFSRGFRGAANYSSRVCAILRGRFPQSRFVAASRLIATRQDVQLYDEAAEFGNRSMLANSWR